jgi:hypothetical protein
MGEMRVREKMNREKIDRRKTRRNIISLSLSKMAF